MELALQKIEATRALVGVWRQANARSKIDGAAGNAYETIFAFSAPEAHGDPSSHDSCSIAHLSCLTEWHGSYVAVDRLSRAKPSNPVELCVVCTRSECLLNTHSFLIQCRQGSI